MKKSAVIAYIHQLCCLGLGGQIIMPELTKALHELIPSRSNTFLYADRDGRIANVFSETLLIPDEISPFSEVRIQRHSKCAACQFRKAMHIGLPSDDFYPLLWHSFNQCFLLNIPIRESDAGILGAMQFYRYASDPAFSHEDMLIMARLSPIISQGVKATRNARGPFVESGDTGLIIANQALEILYMSPRGRELLYLATHPVVSVCISERLQNISGTPPIVQELCRSMNGDQVEVACSPVMVRQNNWGKFYFYAEWLESQGKEKLIGITIKRHIPLVLRLAKSIRLQDLSPRQKEACLLLAYGCTYGAIAERLNVSQHTVCDYIKEIYSRLAVHNREQLMDKLKAGFV